MFFKLNLKLQKPNLIYDAAQINLAYQNVEESRYSRKVESEDLKSQIENVNVFSMNMDFDSLAFLSSVTAPYKAISDRASLLTKI